MILLAIDFLDSDSDKKLVLKIYNEYMAWFRKRAHRFSDNDTICEDIAQECMLQVIKHIDSIKNVSETQLPFYLATVLDNTATNFMKKEKRTASAKYKGILISNVNPEKTNIEDEVERKYTYQVMKESYEKLSPRDKGLIFLRYGIELKYDAIADVAKIKKTSARMTVRRSVMRLKEKMEKEELL